MTTPIWTITTCDSDVSTGYIFCAHWTCSAVDGDYSGSVYSTCSFGEGAPTIPYSQVTQAEMLNWCWAGGVDKDATEAAVLAQIEAQKNPVQQTGLPWTV